MKKVQTIRIDYESITADTALRLVRGVVQSGKISKGRGIDHYCWASRYNTGEVVATRQKKTKNSADSFYVYLPKKKLTKSSKK